MNGRSVESVQVFARAAVSIADAVSFIHGLERRIWKATHAARSTDPDVHESLDGGATSCLDVASPRCAGSISPWGKACFATSR